MTTKPRVISARMCLGKNRYDSRADARHAAIPGLQQYYCPFCGGWHNGNPSGRFLKAAIAGRRRERRSKWGR